LRNSGSIFSPGQTVSIPIPASEIDPSQPLEVTVYPIDPAPGINSTLDPDLTLTGISPGLPIPSRDLGQDSIFYTQVQPNTQYQGEVVDFTGSGPYLLEVSSEDASNDSSLSAPFLGNVSDNPSVNGFVGRSDGDDWFQFRVPSNGEVRVTLEVADDNAQLEIFGTDILGFQGNQIGLAQAGVGSSGSITENLTTGNYYVRVTPANNSANIPDGGQASTEYTLRVDPLTGNPGNNNPGNNNPGNNNPGNSSFNGSAQDVLRFWDFTAQSHIFTADRNEIDELTGQINSYRREGNEFDVPVNDGDPVFRYENTATGSIFLSFENTIQNILPQFRNDGVAFNAYKPDGTTEQRPANVPAEAIPVYRLANLDAEAVNPLNITHFYTSDPSNRELVLDTLNYRDESVGFWALPASTDGIVG
jgi:hypothetical protein